VISDQPPIRGTVVVDSDDQAAGSMRTVALKGGRWTAGKAVSVQMLSAVATMILARLLTPEDFGIVAIVTLVLLLFAIVTDVGFGASIVRRESVDSNYLSSMFWASSALGLVTMGLSVIGSTVFATAAGDPAATPYLVVASVILMFRMVATVPRYLLLRRFRFGAAAGAEVGAFALYMALAIPLAAFTPLGAWAIVLGRVAASGCRLTIEWMLSGWWPQMYFRLAEVREDLAFNLGYLGQRVSEYTSQNIDYWLVGAILGTATLGVYYIAYVLPNVLRQRLTTAVDQTLFVTGASFANDRARVSRAYTEALRLAALVGYPMLVGLALVAAEIVPIAFGEQWLDAVAPMSILAIAAAVNIAGPIGSATLAVIGLPHRNIAVNLTSVTLIAVGVAATIRVGELVAVAWVVLGATVVAVLLQMALLLRPLALSWRSVVNSLWPATVAVAVMAAAVFATRAAITSLGGLWFRLSALVIVGVVVYLGLGYVVFRDAFNQAWADLRVVLLLGRTKQRADA
jgi:O-antigen/teichoic acid export membrane protein